MHGLRVWLIATALTCPLLMGAQCVTDARDAVIGGAYDFISETTATILGQLIPLAEIFEPAAP